MHLVDGHGAVQGVGPVAPGHPVPVFPGVVQVPDDGGGAGRAFVGKGEGVGLVHPVAPYLEATWYLYSEPAPTPGMNPSQMPDWTRCRKGWRPLSQPLKSPVTQICSASGAHTAK